MSTPMKPYHLFRKIFAVVALAIAMQSIAFSQPINDAQKQNFRQEIEKLMKTHSDVASFTSNQTTFDLGMATTFRGTFIETQKTIVFNDLLPTKVEGEKYLNPITYTQFAQRYYPEGLDVQFSVEDITFEPIGVKGLYTAIVKVSKKTRGFYSGKRIHTYAGTLYFYVQTRFTENQVQKVAISLMADPEKHAQVQSTKSMGGLYAGLSGSYTQSVFFNPTIFTNSLWETKMGNQIVPAFELFYMVTKGFGIGTGIKLGSYSTIFSINSFSEQLSSSVTDIDGDSYNPIYEIPELSELNSIQTLDIPFCLKFRGGKGKAGLYLDLGVIYSMFRESTYTLDGTTTLKGYYPAYNVVLEDIPEYNFKTTIYRSDVYTMTVPANNLSATAAFGISFMVHPSVAMKIGANVQYGLTDLLYNESRHPFDFYATTGEDGDKTNLLSAGVEIGLYYRLVGGSK